MATDFDRVTNPEVFTLDADPLESSMACCFHRPDRWHAFLILDLHVKPRMGNEVVDLSNLAFHCCPL